MGHWSVSNLLLRKVTPRLTDLDTKESILVKGIVGEFVSIPCVEVQLVTNLVNGSVKVS